MARLNEPVKGSTPPTTVRNHLESLVRRGRKEYEKQLVGPEFPYEITYLWDWLIEIRSAPRMGLSGLDPLNWQDIAAWAMLTDREIFPHEVRALIQLDYFLNHPTPPPEEQKP